MKRSIAVFMLLAVIFSGSVFSQSHSRQQLEEISQGITSEEVYGYVLEMVDPKYKGRLAGSPEYMDVARWAADLFSQWGIEPAGDNGTYFQMFNQPYSDVFSPGEFSVILDGVKKQYQAPEDYYPGSNAANGRVQGELVYVGYGISADELEYDDYKGVDVTNRIVLIAPGNPYKGDDPALRTQWGAFSSGRYKIMNALQHGASGVIYLDKLASPGGPHSPGFIYVHAGEQPIADIFGAVGKDPRELLSQIDASMTPQSFELGITAVLGADTRYHAEGPTANVVGIIPGSDPVLKDEVIIMGGHLDGQGYLGLLFPSALDNASGVANVMGAARALGQLKGQMKRSVMFILFGAEETGLVGAEHYCRNPWAPLEKTVVFMNLDMVGNGTGLGVYGVESFPWLQRHYEWANDNFIGRSLRTSPFRAPAGRPRTDGAMFALHGFRTFTVAATDRVNPLFYHDPRDVPELLVPEIMRDVARMLFLATSAMANDDSFSTDDLPNVADFLP